MVYTPASIEAEHVVLTGPITGTVELSDGSLINVTPGVVSVDSIEKAQEVAHLIGLRYEAEGHPDDIETDAETGDVTQVPFTYEPTVEG